jgi:hypothetical protein
LRKRQSKHDDTLYFRIWTPKELKKLEKMRKKGHSFEKIAKKLGRYPYACSQKYNEIVLTRRT